MTRYIKKDVERKLFVESMGRCMNPECCVGIFHDNGNIAEKAHITPYCNTSGQFI